jgi:hypothetical protein
LNRNGLHDFSVKTHLGFRLCRRCARADLTATRTRPCRPLPLAEAQEMIKRKLKWVSEFRGLAPFAPRQGEA